MRAWFCYVRDPEYASYAEAWTYRESSTCGPQRSRFANLFVLRCKVLQSPSQHSFIGEQAQWKCWNAIKKRWLVFSCHCHVNMPIQDRLLKAFVKLQMCLLACSNTCYRRYCAAVLHWWGGEVIQRYDMMYIYIYIWYDKFPTMQMSRDLFSLLGCQKVLWKVPPSLL